MPTGKTNNASIYDRLVNTTRFGLRYSKRLEGLELRFTGFAGLVITP